VTAPTLVVPRKGFPGPTSPTDLNTDWLAIETWAKQVVAIIDNLPSGGGGITEITSIGGTIAVTDPTGPTVNIEVGTEITILFPPSYVPVTCQVIAPSDFTAGPGEFTGAFVWPDDSGGWFTGTITLDSDNRVLSVSGTEESTDSDTGLPVTGARQYAYNYGSNVNIVNNAAAVNASGGGAENQTGFASQSGSMTATAGLVADAASDGSPGSKAISSIEFDVSTGARVYAGANDLHAEVAIKDTLTSGGGNVAHYRGVTQGTPVLYSGDSFSAAQVFVDPTYGATGLWIVDVSNTPVFAGTGYLGVTTGTPSTTPAAGSMMSDTDGSLWVYNGASWNHIT
jgi:hypothetical protein